jgi:predicted lactoylglutathione lyase
MMTKNPFQHIDLRVHDLTVARDFYAQLLPAVGFSIDDGGTSFHCFSAEGETPSKPWFGFTEDPDHQPNRNRIAFWAASREEVDRLAGIAQMAGALNMSGPRACPEYDPTYYAAFFDDPSGNALEICFI